MQSMEGKHSFFTFFVAICAVCGYARPIGHHEAIDGTSHMSEYLEFKPHWPVQVEGYASDRNHFEVSVCGALLKDGEYRRDDAKQDGEEVDAAKVPHEYDKERGEYRKGLEHEKRTVSEEEEGCDAKRHDLDDKDEGKRKEEAHKNGRPNEIDKVQGEAQVQRKKTKDVDNKRGDLSKIKVDKERKVREHKQEQFQGSERYKRMADFKEERKRQGNRSDEDEKSRKGIDKEGPVKEGAEEDGVKLGGKGDDKEESGGTLIGIEDRVEEEDEEEDGVKLGGKGDDKEESGGTLIGIEDRVEEEDEEEDGVKLGGKGDDKEESGGTLIGIEDRVEEEDEEEDGVKLGGKGDDTEESGGTLIGIEDRVEEEDEEEDGVKLGGKGDDLDGGGDQRLYTLVARHLWWLDLSYGPGDHIQTSFTSFTSSSSAFIPPPFLLPLLVYLHFRLKRIC
ncbi:hypothetical protein TcWFU_006380 [Taenia crassiceps]|uniref:Uncharacterized protein n=1 Tax=Taenia crassiceps TaxID=6207 RepID=A0ABR4QBC5_9CEST